MKKLFFVICGFIISTFLGFSQEKEPTVLDSVVVSGNRATTKTPVSFTTIGHNSIKEASPVASLPLLLNLQPSVVATTESGSGLGYTRLSVRGSDATRTNVTLNGVAINDAESQEVFWVNLPALTNFLESVQLQRGVGTSANGPGAFGASINMQTQYTAPQAYGSAEAGYGSYNTSTASIGAGSGLLNSGFSFDVRYSQNYTDGYIRNGKGKLHSLFATAGLLKGNSSFKIIYLMGDQHTGITWNGISRDMLEKDRRGNSAGEYWDAAGNSRYYENETDNYTQHYLQGFFSHQFSQSLLWVNTLNYTKGDGYYENYKAAAKFSKYGLGEQNIGNVLHKKSDLIIRQAMDNNYYVISSTLKYDTGLLRINGGVTGSYYDGLHFGNVIWAMYNENIPKNYRWYDNSGAKWEGSAYARGEYDIGPFTLFADLQYRHVSMKMRGDDKDFVSLDNDFKYDFFNPKGGITYLLNDNNMLYASLAVGHKEPSRSDIKEAVKSGRGQEMKAEMVLDYEIGYKLSLEKFAFGLNLYFMEYNNQLVATGKLSDVGYVIKENVPDSYRRGVEVTAGWKTFSFLRLDGNISLSMNQIKNYTAWVDRYDNPDDWGSMPQIEEHYKSTTLAMSPSVVGMIMATVEPFKGAKLSLNGKYVGRQFYDNTSSIERSIPSYFVMGGDVSYKVRLGWKESNVTFSLFVDNILNNKYVSNAWVYRAVFANGAPQYLEEGLFPQAETNFIVKMALNF